PAFGARPDTSARARRRSTHARMTALVPLNRMRGGRPGALPRAIVLRPFGAPPGSPNGPRIRPPPVSPPTRARAVGVPPSGGVGQSGDRGWHSPPTGGTPTPTGYSGRRTVGAARVSVYAGGYGEGPLHGWAEETGHGVTRGAGHERRRGQLGGGVPAAAAGVRGHRPVHAH